MALVLYLDGCGCKYCAPIKPENRMRWKNRTYRQLPIRLNEILGSEDRAVPELVQVVEGLRPDELLLAINRDCLHLVKEEPDAELRSGQASLRLLKAVNRIRKEIKHLKITAVCWSGNIVNHIRVDFPTK